MTQTKTQNGATVPALSPAEAAAKRKEIMDQAVSKTLEHLQSLEESGNIKFPANYIKENAIKGASLYLSELKDKDGNLAMTACSVPSIANAIMQMCLDGLSVWKKQGYFIVYGKELHWQPDYRGHILMAKRDADVKEVNAQCIYQDDEFVYQVDSNNGRKKLINHTPKLEGQDITKIKGAYAIVVFNDGSTDLEVMTLAQIRQAWLQGFGGGNTKAHQNFTDRMCRKTVINRATNNLIGSSDDSEIMIDDGEETDVKTKIRDNKVIDKGNAKHLDIQDTSFEVVSNSSSGASDNPEDLSSLGSETQKKNGPEY